MPDWKTWNEVWRGADDDTNWMDRWHSFPFWVGDSEKWVEAWGLHKDFGKKSDSFDSGSENELADGDTSRSRESSYEV